MERYSSDLNDKAWEKIKDLFQVERFPAIVTMDSHGNSLHADINKSSLEKLSEYSEAVF